LGLLSALYNLGLTCRTFGYRHFKKPGKLPVKVISIGNITLGGTGKTPAVIRLAEEAAKRGLKPCILTRGYKGKAKATCFVSKGDGPVLGVDDAGDEAYLMAGKLKGIPVVKGSKRYEAGLFALNNLEYKPSLMILDDGFQHIALERDIDVVLIDGTNPFGNEKLFPEGILREPLYALKRVEFAIITKSDQAGEDTLADIKSKLETINHDMPVYMASHKPSGLINMSGDTKELDYLANRKVFAFAGIANTEYFESTIKTCGAEIAGFHKYRDHHLYSVKDMDKLKQDAAGLDIITTEKDLVKLKDLNIPDNLFALSIDFSVDNVFFDDLFRRLA
jgi:tetraacyldisaccharide 4'-kinase